MDALLFLLVTYGDPPKLIGKEHLSVTISLWLSLEMFEEGFADIKLCGFDNRISSF